MTKPYMGMGNDTNKKNGVERAHAHNVAYTTE